MTFLKRTSTWLFLVVILLSWIIIRLDVAPASVNNHSVDSTFKVDNALAHLRQIARVPHSLGTAANDSVRQYIVSTCRSLGLDVEERSFSVVDQWNGGVLAARGINIAATLHGLSSAKKKILVMGHYDSEPNALGAGDDGAACVSMLETARALRNGSPLPCDVLFLFTNGEEEGLLGAQAFSRDSAQRRDIGLVLNFDGRGDAGKCLMFRTSDNNRWIIDEFARSPIHHGAGSLYSELFKLLPNNTDFSPFEKTHIPGMDFAFAEGFVHYHNLTDNVDNIDKGMLQEEGDNMLGSVRHFSRLDLSTAPPQTTNETTGNEPTGNERTANETSGNESTGNSTCFNLLADMFIHYPPSVNFFLLILTNALVLFALVSGLYRRQVRPVHVAIGFLLFPITLAILYFLTGWSLDAIRAAWPLYLGYYPNAYNSYYFYLALAAEAVAVFTLVYRWPLRKWSMASLFIAVLVFQTIVLDLVYRFIPAGVYFLYFPLIGSALAYPLSSKSNFFLLLGALLPILFLAPLIYSLAELFDVQPEAAMVAPVTGLLLGLLLPILSRSLRDSRWGVPVAAMIVVGVSAGLGVLHGGYSPRQPLKTDLRYFVRADDHQAWWVSHSTKPDRWNKTLFVNPSLRPNAYQYAHPFPGVRQDLYNQAPFIDMPASVLSVTKDTLANGHRLLYLHCQPAKGTTTIHLNFSPDHPADYIVVEDDHIAGQIDRLDYCAPPDDGFNLVISCKPGKPFFVDLTARIMGIPAVPGFNGYPADVIPTPSSLANTTLVQRSYTFH